MLKNHLADIFPMAELLLSAANEKDTYADMQTLGSNLANEVDAFIGRMVIPVSRISFIGHSLGGVITRACLAHPAMQRYRSRLCTYCSLGSAHLGYQYSDNRYVDIGMWVLKKVKNSTALHQFSLSDSKDPLTSYMYRLSDMPVLHLFKNVLLVASPQDGYAPYTSARLEVHGKSFRDNKLGAVHRKMVDNLLRPMYDAGTNLVRYEVHFHVEGQGLDGRIKRAAHIMLLESLPFIRHLVAVNRKYFE